MVLAVAASLTMCYGAAAQGAGEIPPSHPGWRPTGDARIGDWQGEPALLIRRGQIDNPELSLADGTLEFEVLIPEGRTFVGMRLRVGPDGTNENIYLRPHKSGLPDAIQYNPAFGGAGQWQLWHGPDATAFVDFRPGEWLSVRVDLDGPRAAVFLNDTGEPTLVTHRLASGRRDGHVGFWANQPGAGPEDPWTAVIRGVRVTPGRATHSFEPSDPPATPEGTVTRWSLSLPWSAEADADVDDFPPSVIESDWATVEADAGGLLPIQRHRPRPRGGVATVLARLVLEADRARTVAMDLGFSDDATVFLNGRILATGRNGYSYNFPRRDGLLTPDQMTVHLPLRPGENELLIRLADGFGGWGLQARFHDLTGLVSRP